MFRVRYQGAENQADFERAPPTRNFSAAGDAQSVQATIAAINGYALGVGCTIPLLLDVRIASDNARMGVDFPRVGLMSELGSSYLIARLIGLARTAEMMLTGRQYPRRNASRWDS